MVRELLLFATFCLSFCWVAAYVTKARAYMIHAPKLINDKSNTTNAGVLEFTQNTPKSPVHINGTIDHVQPKGKHGFHIHALGSLENFCVSAGAHFNPLNQTHGAPNSMVRHVGDLGNVNADENGIVSINITDATISLNGPNSIIGRSVVIHQKPDDLGMGNESDSKKTGNAGSRLFCGVIGITEEISGPLSTTASIATNY